MSVSQCGYILVLVGERSQVVDDLRKLWEQDINGVSHDYTRK